MNFKKIFTVVLMSILMAAISLTAGCTGDDTQVFTVKGEDTIVITFDSAELVNMEMSGVDQNAFVIKRADEVMIQGRIMDRDLAIQMEMAFTADPSTHQQTESLNNGNSYTLWCTYDAEWSYICHIADTNMAMFMSGFDQDFTTECFNCMSFAKEEP